MNACMNNFSDFVADYNVYCITLESINQRPEFGLRYEQ